MSQQVISVKDRDGFFHITFSKVNLEQKLVSDLNRAFKELLLNADGVGAKWQLSPVFKSGDNSKFGFAVSNVDQNETKCFKEVLIGFCINLKIRVPEFCYT